MPLTKTSSPGDSSHPASRRADHHRLRAGDDRLGDVAGVLETAVGDHGHTGGGARQPRLVHRGDLGHSHPGDHAGGADRAGSHADLDRVGAGVDERLGAGPGRDVAADDLDVLGGRVGLQPPDHVEQQPDVPVRGVGDQHVDAGVDEGRGALPGVAEVADRRPDEEPAVGVLRGVRELLGLHEVLDRDEAAEAAVVVDQGQPLTLVLAQQRGGVVAGDPDPTGDQRRRRHHLVDLGGRPLGDRGEAQVAVGDDAHQAVVGVDDREPGDAVLAADAVEVLQRRVRADGDRVGDDPGLGPLHQVDLVGLVLDREVAVQHPEAALAGHRDRHPGLGDRVHGGADQRHLEADLPGEPRGGVDLVRREVGLPRQQQHVVVRQAQRGELLGDLHAAILGLTRLA